MTDGFSYSVSVNEAITDVNLWRIIINGYPYKSIQELGCNNKQEAFTATKQAIYCYIHGNNPNDYQAIGEAGQRTLNALNKILQDAKNSKETQISNNIKINREADTFKVDNINKECVSKIYSIEAGTTITNYKVSLSAEKNQLPEEIKITDLNNNEKQKFNLKSNLGKHKYWKYQNLTGYRKTNYCGITELSFGKTKIEFNKEKDLTQIANKEDVKNGKIFASNNEESAYLVFDKNNTTYWDGRNVDAFIGYKFDFPVEVIIQPYTEDVINQFKIQYSDDGKNYYDAAETFIFVKNREMQSFKLQSDLGKHKYWRYKNLTGYRQSDYCGISEIKFYKEF